MEKQKLKSYLQLIALVLVVVHFTDILRGIGLLARLLTPLFIGILLAFVLNRPCKLLRTWYEKRWRLKEKTARGLAIFTVYFLALCVVVLVAWMVIPELVQNLRTFAEQADEYLLSAQAALNQFTAGLGLQQIDLTALVEAANRYLGSFSSALDEMLSQMLQVTSSLVSGVVTGFVSIILSIYILCGKERLLTQLRRVLRAFLPKSVHAGFGELSRIVSQVFGDYVAGQCKEAVILGSLCFAGMMILRLDYAGLISVIVTICALIPIVGAFVAGAVGVILLLFVSPGKALIFLIFLVVLQQVEGNIIYPKVVGRKIGLPGMWVLLSVSVWGGLFGIWGMLLGVPVTTILYQLLGRVVRARENAEVTP